MEKDSLYREGDARFQQPSRNAMTSTASFGFFDVNWTPLLPEQLDARVVDVACGYGEVLRWLRNRGYGHVEGYDLSPHRVAACREAGLTDVQEGDLREVLARQRGEYDVIIMKDILEHFQKADAVSVMEKAHAALKPGGRLIVQVPNAESPFFGGVRYDDFTHEEAFTPRSLLQVVSAAGFGRLKIARQSLPGRGIGRELRGYARLMARQSLRTLARLASSRAAITLDETLLAIAYKSL